MVTMTGSFRAGQPTNAAVIKRAFAMAMIFKISDRFFMELPRRPKWGRTIATARGSVNTTKARWGEWPHSWISVDAEKAAVRGPGGSSYANGKDELSDHRRDLQTNDSASIKFAPSHPRVIAAGI
jgi:hypothetical protein